METLDSGIGSRSPTPDNNLSHMNSSKATKVATISNHINNNSHTDSDGTYKSKSKDRGDANQVPEATATVSANGANDADGGGNDSSENTQGNTNTNSTSSNGGKTYREFNRHSSTHHGQYKKYNGNPHYGYGHNMHYRYAGGPRRYGNKHFNSNGNYNHHNQHYQGQNYHHQQYQSQEHFHHSRNGTAAANSSGSSTGTSNGSSHPHSHHQQHHNGTQGTQYYNSHVGTGTVAGLHRNATPQVFISSDQVDTLSWGRRGGETTNTNWSSPSLETESASSAVPISLNVSLVNNNKGFYSPSPQNASPAISPSTTDSSDGYSLQEENSTGVTVCSTARQSNSVESVQYTSPSAALVDPLGSSHGGAGTTAAAAAAAATYSYAPLIYHPSGVYAAYTSTNSILAGNGTRSFSNGIPPFYNPGLLMSADSSNYALVKADSSINSNNSDKTLEWTTEDGIIFNPFSVTDRGEEIFGPSAGTSLTDRSTNATTDYIYAPFAFTSAAAHYPPANKKRFYNGPMPGKLSPVPQNHRYHYPRKLPAGFPREWHADLDPEHFVSTFSKFGEVKERPPQLAQNPQPDSLSEGIWLKFLANQQTTETFRKKMELWRDVYRILRTLNINSNFKHDPRNFPTFGLQVVGSTMSGFGSNTSDVDMCLLVRGSDVDQRYEAVDKLQVLYGALSATQWLDNVELIYAKVPILKFRDPKRFLEVDLNCNNFVGIRNTHLLYCYSQADWRLKPLVLVVKLWAHHHGINDAKNMTISSYSLVLMVIHFLQCGVEDPVLPSLQQMYPEKFSNTTNILNVRIDEVLPPWQSKNQENIGNLLIQFLEYYALKFDYSEIAVSVRIGGTIPIKQAAAHRSIKNDPHQWKYLCIEEPFDRTNTARSVYDRNTFDRILGIFNLSYQRLLASRNLESIFTQISETDARTMSVLIR